MQVCKEIRFSRAHFGLVAWPLAYLLMNRWLAHFAYRIDVGFRSFLVSGGIALIVALVTVSQQALMAARANPVDSLKYE